MIEVRNLTKTYNIEGQVITAVDNVTLDVSEGEFVSIVGHSGSGKTTLLSLLGGLTRPDSGTVVMDGVNLWDIDDNRLSEFRNKKINFIFQFASLIPTLTVKENVCLPSVFGQYNAGVDEYAVRLLEMVGLSDKINSYPSQLSGGQQRRVAIARAFINTPKVILADEPTGDLDEETEKEIISIFNRMNADDKVTFIIVTHNTELAGQAKRQLRMSNGVLKEV